MPYRGLRVTQVSRGAISKRENDSLLRCAGCLIGGQLTGSSGSRRDFNDEKASDRFGGNRWANGFAGRSSKRNILHHDAGGVAGADNVGVGPRSRCLRPANDKLYGNFNFGNSPANGTVLFNWNLATGTHSIQLEAGYVPGTTYTGIHYEVAISGGPPGSYISMEAGDFDLSLGGASTLTKLITPVIPSGLTPVSFTCSRTFGGVQNCPQGVTFSAAQNLQDLAADITFMDNGTTGAIIDTTIESVTTTPEPSTMVLAGTALLLAYWGRKRLFGGRQHVPGI